MRVRTPVRCNSIVTCGQQSYDVGKPNEVRPNSSSTKPSMSAPVSPCLSRVRPSLLSLAFPRLRRFSPIPSQCKLGQKMITCRTAVPSCKRSIPWLISEKFKRWVRSLSTGSLPCLNKETYRGMSLTGTDVPM